MNVWTYGEVMERTQFGSESVVIRLLVAALVTNHHLGMQSVADQWHHLLADTCQRMNYAPKVYQRVRSQYRKAQSMFREIVVNSGKTAPMFKELAVPALEQAHAALATLEAPVPAIEPEPEDAPVTVETLDPDISDLLRDLAQEGEAIYEAKGEPSHLQQLCKFAREEVLPRVMEQGKGRAAVAPYTIDDQRYLVIVTESGRKVQDPKTSFTINATVEPYRASQKAPADVFVHTSYGKTAYVRMSVENDPEHKYWAQFIIHKPGRKIRVFGSERRDGEQDWREIISATRRIIMTDERPWYKDVTLDEWSKLPLVDKDS
jgi:hypothetical protein